MLKEVLLPEISENIDSGDVIKILVNIGDKISLEQPVIEVETDKAAFEVPSTQEGIVKEISVKEGDKLNVGGIILKVETNGTDSSDVAEKKEISETKTKAEEKVEPEKVKPEVIAEENKDEINC